MQILLKTEADIAKMRASGRVVADVHARLRELIQPGVTTAELDQAAVETVQRAAPFPPIPPETGRASWPFTVPMSFSIR